MTPNQDPRHALEFMYGIHTSLNELHSTIHHEMNGTDALSLTYQRLMEVNRLIDQAASEAYRVIKLHQRELGIRDRNDEIRDNAADGIRAGSQEG